MINLCPWNNTWVIPRGRAHTRREVMWEGSSAQVLYTPFVFQSQGWLFFSRFPGSASSLLPAEDPRFHPGYLVGDRGTQRQMMVGNAPVKMEQVQKLPGPLRPHRCPCWSGLDYSISSMLPGRGGPSVPCEHRRPRIRSRRQVCAA